MFTFLVIVTSIVFIALLFVAAIRPAKSMTSVFELERRAGGGDDTAAAILRRDGALPDIISLFRVATALLLVSFVLLSVATFGWLLGIIVAIIVALEYGAIARISLFRIYGQKLYMAIEPWLIDITYKLPWLFSLIRTPQPDMSEHRLESRQELQHLVQQSGSVLTVDERKLIVSGLEFADRRVDSVMTPRAVIDTVKKSEFLGPLTLDELHKLGHSRLPVIDGDIDHVIGILHLKSLLALDIKRSVTAEKAMEAKVYYIREDQSLAHALSAFLKTHHHLFIVINEYRETVGLLTLEDTIESLIGRKIVDEFESHDDLRVVALRNPHANNQPHDAQDL